MGIDFAPDGSLYYTDTPFQTPTGYIGRLVRLDPATGQQTVIFDDLRFATDVEFLRDGSFYLALDRGGMIRRYDATFTPRELFSDGTAGDTINFLEPHEVPEPHAAAALAAGAGCLVLRRRSR
jgi:sugar lactone lactonase YvrE